MKHVKKSYIIIISLLVLTVTFFGASYAYFTSKNEEHGKLNIVAGTLDYKIESKDLENNQITLKPNSIKEITVKLTSLNEIDSKYELFYETTNNDVEVGYTGDILPMGLVNAKSSKEIEVFLSNTSSNDATVTFSCEGGFINNSLVKSKGISIPAQISICENYTTHVWNYDYTGDVQEFVSPCDGIYTVETWGASGGISNSYPTNDVGQGKGAYTKGNINLISKTNIYIYVGKKGISTSYNYLTREYDFNGGGYPDVRPFDTYGDNLSSGGGATDIRIINGKWNDFNSLKSRIMVAAGGAGGSYDGSEPGAGGGLVGYNGIKATSDWWFKYDAGYGANQTKPGQLSFDNYLIIGGFGYGGTSSGGGSGGGAGGSGWYGGSGGFVQSGGGGSSFISGHNGCVAIKESSTENNIIQRSDINNENCTDGTTDITCSYHYSNYIFTNTVMIDGAGYNWTTEKGDVVVGMPTHDGTSNMTGNNGNGYAKITYLGK